MRSDDRSSEGLGGWGPAGQTERLGTAVSRKTRSSSIWRVRKFTRPERFDTSRTSCIRGRRRSQSITNTRRSSCANTTPRLTVVAVLPSPGSAEVMATSLRAWALESSRAVRSER